MPPLGTAHWADPEFVEDHYLYRPGTFWLGRSASDKGAPLGYLDDRHICLVSGNRGGKGTSSIITNLCLWPGSLVVVDPKGENATVTAARRGSGREYCEGMGQKVHVLDPFGVARVADEYRSRFNPLDALDPESPESIDRAALLADAIVVVRDDAADPFWDQSARQMVKGLILHVLTAAEYEGRRNLITVRNLITRGYKEGVEALESLGEEAEPAHNLLWEAVAHNEAFGGRVGAMGDTFANMLAHSGKQYESVLQVANRNTEFLDSLPMENCVVASDFRLSDLKTDPKGVSIFLSLPQRFMNTHNRWLRMMIGLILTEMETVRGQPACGHPVLMVLDEFAGLQRMESIETGVAQMAGFGVKMFFVLQSLVQLKAIYRDRWENFLTNCGLKLFFNIDDNFSRDYISKQMGEMEVMRDVRSAGLNSSESDSQTESESESLSESSSRGRTESDGTSMSFGRSVTEGTSHSTGRSHSQGTSESRSQSHGSSSGGSTSRTWSPNNYFSVTTSSSGSMTSSTTTTEGKSENWSESETEGTSRSASASVTKGESRTLGRSESETYGTTSGTTRGATHGMTRGETSGMAETVHKRPLCSPDEIGKWFSRIDDRDHRAFPGLGLALVAGQAPLAFRRVNYYEDPQFISYFCAHPDHSFRAPRSEFVKADDIMFYEPDLPGLWWVPVAGEGKVVSAGDPIAFAWASGTATMSIRAPLCGRVVKVPVAQGSELPEAVQRLHKLMLLPSIGGPPSPLGNTFSSLLPGKMNLFDPRATKRIDYKGDFRILTYEAEGSADPVEELEDWIQKIGLEEAARSGERARKEREERERAAELQRSIAAREARERLRQEEAERKARARKERVNAWLTGAYASGAVLAVDALVTAGTHALGGILLGIGAAGAAGLCCWKAIRIRGGG